MSEREWANKLALIFSLMAVMLSLYASSVPVTQTTLVYNPTPPPRSRL
jgi:hypothetical protein